MNSVVISKHVAIIITPKPTNPFRRPPSRPRRRYDDGLLDDVARSLGNVVNDLARDAVVRSPAHFERLARAGVLGVNQIAVGGLDQRMTVVKMPAVVVGRRGFFQADDLLGEGTIHQFPRYGVVAGKRGSIVIDQRRARVGCLRRRDVPVAIDGRAGRGRIDRQDDGQAAQNPRYCCSFHHPSLFLFVPS